MKIRAVTILADIPVRSQETELARLGHFARMAREAFATADIEVQTIRLATSLLREYSPAKSDVSWAERAVALETACIAAGFEYLSLGPASRDVWPQVIEILQATTAVLATVEIVDLRRGVVQGEAITIAAQIMRQAAQIEAGFGNLRFAALANVPPGTPFFPAAYHQGGPPRFALAMEAADLALTACRNAEDAAQACNRLTAAIEGAAAHITAVAEELQRTGIEGTPAPRFAGIDFSLAPFPSPEISIGAALEALTGGSLGSPGTLAAAALLTEAIERASFRRAGFCGLMMPVLEDVVLARRAAEGRLCLGELLQWSAVCGTGLDTVPLPGNAGQTALERVLYDVAMLSCRLNKPLTARLMPLPGKSAGDPVHFDFPYFADGGVMPLPEAESEGCLGRTREIRCGR